MNNSYLKLRRRLLLIDESIDKILKSTIYNPPNICSSFRNYDELISYVISDVAERIYYLYFDYLDDSSTEWGSVYNLIDEYVKNKFGEKLKIFYHINCGD